LGTSASQSIIGDYGTIDTYFINNNSGTLRFHVGGGTTSDEKMRIDASGNVLVGKLTNALNTAGIELASTGYIAASIDGDVAGYFNRKTSDGDILRFYKDGSTVGSIGSQFGTSLKINTQGTLQLESGSNNRYLYFDFDDATPNLYPSPDATLNIGRFNRRFKDLYMSGGVYLGGTGAANKLDDYEEGTFTLTWTGTGGTANSTNVMSYVKVGSRVTISGNTTSATPNATGTLELTGLPFAANDDAVGAMLYRYMSPPSGAHNLVMYLGSGQTKLEPYWASSQNYTRLTSSHFAVNSANDIYFSITYQTNS
jgi:hypothetical protein